MKNGEDFLEELEGSVFDNKWIIFMVDLVMFKEVYFYIIVVFMLVSESKVFNFKLVFLAFEMVGKVLKKGDYVIFEFIVYLGCIEEDCLFILEELLGLKFGQDFKIGYFFECINLGDKEWIIEKILKIVFGSDEEVLKEILKIYGVIIKVGVYEVFFIKVVEVVKVIENMQCDFNILFVNELFIIFDMMGIDMNEVLEVVGIKWNFLKFLFGFVGGYCIGVDLYYFIYKVK